jgi:integrin beta 3
MTAKEMAAAVAAVVRRAIAATEDKIAQLSTKVAEIEGQVKSIPAGPQGEKGIPGDPGTPGDLGRDGTNGADGQKGEKGDPGEPGRDGRDGPIGERGKNGRDGIDGKDGKDAIGFEDIAMEYDGERAFTVRFVRGERAKEFNFTLPLVLDRGVFKEGETYQRGDSLTFGGSLWIAQKDAPEGKPGLSDDWRLACKRGRDGKDGVVRSFAAPTTVKLS